MIAQALRHLRSNAIAYAALFVALSGTAYAATQLPKNSVGAKQLKKQSVNAAKVKKNSLTGNQINENKLGKVPEAAKLDGKIPADFLAAKGTAVNADKLDGVDSAVFGDVQTYAGMNFEPRDSEGIEKIYEGTGSISCKGASAEDFTQRVQLPEGARVTRLDFRYVDNEAGSNGGLELRAFDTFEQTGAFTVPIATAATAETTSSSRRTATTTVNPPAVVDNGTFSYQLNWSPAVCSTSMELVGAAVHYTLPTG